VNVLLSERFDGDHDWPVGTEGAFTRTVVDGAYRIDFAPVRRGVGPTWWPLEAPSTAGFHEVFATVGARTPLEVGCGVSLAGDGPGGYPRITLLVNDIDGGEFSVFLERTEGAEFEVLLDWRAAGPGMSDESVDLLLMVDGVEVSVLVGGEYAYVGEPAIEPLTVTQAGLVVVTPFAGDASSCTFDDVILVSE
jgi:hypothetical protein